MEIIADQGTVFLIIAGVVSLFMAWGIGANDLANAMGTSVGSKALTVRQAIIVAAIFEFAGAVLAGGHVTGTIRKGIIDSSSPVLLENPQYLVYGMIAALLAAGIWLLVASHRGWPVSTTHSIVGAIVGFGIVGIGFDSVAWSKIGTIAASWVISPLVGGFVAFVLIRSVQKLILDREEPFAAARVWAPFYIFLVGFIISLVTLFKGLKHLNLAFSVEVSFAVSGGIGLFVAAVGGVLIRRVQAVGEESQKGRFSNVERVFGYMMIFTACSMAFAHGSNDVANAVGPLAAVVSIVQSGGEVTQKAGLPVWVLLIGGVGILIGLATMGYRVMATIGTKITELTPSRGFCAELAAATTVVIASRTGIPVSTTHILVGSVLGVGLARGLGAIDMRVFGTIAMSWIVTLPAGAILAMVFFYIMRAIFG